MTDHDQYLSIGDQDYYGEGEVEEARDPDETTLEASPEGEGLERWEE